MSSGYEILRSTFVLFRSFVLILDAFSMVHIHMNIYTNTWEWCGMMFLCSLPTVMAAIGATVQIFDNSTHVAEWLFVFICLLMFFWIGFLGVMGLETDGGVPTRYTAVTSIDILGLDEKVQGKHMVVMKTIIIVVCGRGGGRDA